MIYTKTGQYAIRAAMFLARRPKGKKNMASIIAKEEGIPGPYLAKILQKMTRYGYVESSKGRSGGFTITELALKSSILEIAEKMEGPVINLKCATGLKECSSENPCPLHKEWAELRNRIYQLISTETLEEVSIKYRHKT